VRRLTDDLRAVIRQLAAIGLMLAASACAEKEMPTPSFSLPEPRVLRTTVEPAQTPAGTAESVSKTAWYKYETGIASWYGKELQGRKTASGEIFDMYGLSAAHRTLPFGAAIRVTNLDNLKSITLKVNDRGPFTGNKILELSYGAARELGFVSKGTARVDIEIQSPVQQDATRHTVLAGTFVDETSAQLLRDRLTRKFGVIRIAPFDTNLGKIYRVYVGSYGTREKAEKISGRLKLEGVEPFVLRKD
jgi:rare lipoprotein A